MNFERIESGYRAKQQAGVQQASMLNRRKQKRTNHKEITWFVGVVIKAIAYYVFLRKKKVQKEETEEHVKRRDKKKT